MNNNDELPSQEFPKELIIRILKEEAPEEIDIVDTISDELFKTIDVKALPQQDDKFPMFSFSGVELDSFLTTTLYGILFTVVYPFVWDLIQKIVDDAQEKTSEYLLDQISEALEENKRDKQSRIKEIWTTHSPELIREIEQTAIGRLTKAEAKRISNLTVKEISDDKILFGNIIADVIKHKTKINKKR